MINALLNKCLCNRGSNTFLFWESGSAPTQSITLEKRMIIILYDLERE